MSKRLMNSAELETKLTAFADDLMSKARAEGVKLEEAVKVFREVREFLSILTKDPGTGDKPAGRRSTMTGMRKRIAAAGGSNGRAEPPVSHTGD
jgi:hypothetical protein